MGSTKQQDNKLAFMGVIYEAIVILHNVTIKLKYNNESNFFNFHMGEINVDEILIYRFISKQASAGNGNIWDGNNTLQLQD